MMSNIHHDNQEIDYLNQPTPTNDYHTLTLLAQPSRA